MQPGFQPGEGAVVGELQSTANCVIHALVPQKDRHKVLVGQEVKIWLPVSRVMILKRKIDTIATYSERDLRDSPFSSRFGGELATEIKGENTKDAPLDAQYKCSVPFHNAENRIRLGMTSVLVVPSTPQSVFSMIIDALFRTFNWESIA